MHESESREPLSYRTRWWATVKAGTARRVRWPWGAVTGLVVPLLSGVVTLSSAAATNQVMDLSAAVTGLLGALGGAILWYLIAVLISMRLAPSEIVAADAEVIRGLEERVATAEPLSPQDKITLFDAHIDRGRPLIRQIRNLRQTRPAPPQSDWGVPLFDARDWLRDGLALVTEHCIGRKQNYLVAWRAVPSALRNVTSSAEAEGHAGVIADKWMEQAMTVLRDCISWLETR